MRTVHRQLVAADDPLQQRAGRQLDLVAGLGPWVGLFMKERIRHLILDMLDERAAQDHVDQLLAAADAEYWLIALEHRLHDTELE